MKRFKELCYLNPKITIEFKDERDGTQETFHFEGGIRQFVEDMNNKPALSSAQFFSGSAEDPEGGTVEIDIAMMYCDADTDKVLSFVNNVITSYSIHYTKLYDIKTFIYFLQFYAMI